MLRLLLILFSTALALTWTGFAQADIAYFSGIKHQKQLETIKSADIQCHCTIALGREGLEKATRLPQVVGPIYTGYVSAATLHEFQNQRPELQISGLYGEVDPLKQIQLGKILTGQRVVVFYSDRSHYLTKRIPSSDLIKTKKSSIRNTLSLLEDRKAVVAIPDSAIWNRESFRVAAMSLYRQGKVLVGFSDALVKAGALASLYYKDDVYISELIALIIQNKNNNETPSPSYPKIYSIAFNEKVANSLNIKIPEMTKMLEILNEEDGNG